LADQLAGNKLWRYTLAASSTVLPELIFPVYEVAFQLSHANVLAVGGFQSSLEKDILELLIVHGSEPVTICPARSVSSVKTLYKGKLWQAVKQGMAEGRVTLESPFPDSVRRATKQTAIIRNTWMVERADAVLILHATPGGETERMAKLTVELGKPLATLDHPANQHLIDLGAYPTSASDPLLGQPNRWGEALRSS